jgi:hypothetical protein
MDNYPKHLTPPKDFRGNIDHSKFDEWWAWAKADFPDVPENVAHYWLHENWGISPYDYLVSKNYTFTAVEWSSSRLSELLSEWDGFDPEHKDCLRAGHDLCHKNEFGHVLPLAVYIMENKRYPQPIVILDNRDGHLQVEYEFASRVPPGYILIEGHFRLNIGLYLLSKDAFGPNFDAWLMTKSPPKRGFQQRRAP